MKKLFIALFIVNLLIAIFPLVGQEGEVVNEVTEVTEVDTEQTPLNPIPEEDTEAAVIAEAPSVGNEFLNLIKNLFFFVLILGALYFFLKFLKKRSQNGMISDDFMKIVSTQQLTASRFLHIVKVGEEFYWISSTDGGISLLEKLTDKDLVDQLNAKKQLDQPTIIESFREFIQKWTSPSTKPLSNEEKSSETIENLKKQSERLKNL